MRHNVTFEEIVTAAESIIARGDNPTIEKIRISIGSRGSNSTISKHLNHWRKRTTHKECYINHITPINENIIDSFKSYDPEIIGIRNELFSSKSQYNNSQQELAIAKNELNYLHKYHEAWQKEKEQYLEDLKQAHKISLTVLTENYRNDLNKMETKVNSLLDKIEKYIDKHKQERETFIIKLQELTNQVNITKRNNHIIKRKLLSMKMKNNFLKQCLNKKPTLVELNNG